jgi:hypothetical protein
MQEIYEVLFLPFFFASGYAILSPIHGNDGYTALAARTGVQFFT